MKPSVNNLCCELCIQIWIVIYPVKANCLICGKYPFATLPIWYTNGIELEVKDEISYLGVKLSNKS